MTLWLMASPIGMILTVMVKLKEEPHHWELELRFLNYWCQTAILRFSINEAAEEVYIKTVIEPLLGKPYDQNDYECL